MIDKTFPGFIGIDERGVVVTGYDDHPDEYQNSFRHLAFEDPEDLTERLARRASATERVALADKMIARWTAYRDAALTEADTFQG